MFFIKKKVELALYILGQTIIIHKKVIILKSRGKSLYFIIFDVELQILLLNLFGLGFFRLGLVGMKEISDLVQL